MRLYLDDDVAAGELRRRLEAAGHGVHVHPETGRESIHDAIHLALAIVDGRIILTGNYRDFAALHGLVAASGGHHPGILAIRQDNDPRRDMRAPQVVAAIAKVELASIEISDQLIILNHYR